MAELEKRSIDFLWQSFLNGDDNCFSLIYKNTINALLNYGLKFSYDRDLVHDCLQEVFIDLFLKRKKAGNKIQKLKPYLFVASRNSIIKRMVKENRFRFVDIDGISDTLDFNIEYSVEQMVIKSEISKEVNEKLLNAVNNLAPRQKEVVYLKFEEELDYSDIADIMKISVESARKSMHRSILSLRNQLDRTSFQTLFFVIGKKRLI